MEKNNKKKKVLTCYKFNGKGHYTHNCPSTLAGNETSAWATMLANNDIISLDEEEEDESNHDFSFRVIWCAMQPRRWQQPTKNLDIAR